MLVSINSYSEWTEMTENVEGTKYYVDKDTYREHNGFVYLWTLSDYLVPLGDTRVMSSKIYMLGDCDVMRFKTLSFIHYFQPMGNGENMTDTKSNPEWLYANPNGVTYYLLEEVCKHFR